MKIELKKTSRGFAVMHFFDAYDKPCSIQESSLATEPAIWFGNHAIRMHLTIEMVEALLPLLIGFVETGRLIQKEEVSMQTQCTLCEQEATLTYLPLGDGIRVCGICRLALTKCAERLRDQYRKEVYSLSKKREKTQGD